MIKFTEEEKNLLQDMVLDRVIPTDTPAEKRITITQAAQLITKIITFTI